MVDSKPGDIFQPGDFLNNTYRIEDITGRGGTSEVYRARNDISGRLTAIKVLKQEFSGDAAFITLMRREEEIRELRHDAIVRCSENHRTPSGLVYLLMDYVEGPALDTLMKQGGMAAGDLVEVCRRVCDGLRLAHSKKIFHRDLSPTTSSCAAASRPRRSSSTSASPRMPTPGRKPSSATNSPANTPMQRLNS